MTNLLILLIRAYQKTLSPDYGWFRQRHPYGFCRYAPTCSTYAAESLRRHGLVRGLWLAGRRVLRCHPFATPRLDPVPTPNHQDR